MIPVLRPIEQLIPPTGQDSRPETPASALPTLGGQAISPYSDLFAGLKHWQREVLTARIVILSEIDAHSKATGQSLNRSIKAFLTSVSNGGPEHLKRAAAAANNRKGNSRLLSCQTIYRWYQLRGEEGNPGLIPADPEAIGSDNIPLWAPAFLEVYRQPSKPSVADALRQMGDAAPPYHQVNRFLKKYSNLDMHRGRMTGSELRAIRGYTKRDFADLLPMDIIVADGHSFKAYVSHPVHGKRFLPEVETVIDVATRCCVGWSTGLAESGQVVADALRHTVTISEEKPVGGQFAILYTDNGAGNRAKMNSDEVTGIVARIGGTIKFGIAGNPQGRGVIERLNESLWLPAAKKLISYNGKDMDAMSQRKRLKIIDKDLKDTGSSKHLLSWPQFIDFLAGEIAAYNNRPHRSLPKFIDPSDRKRNMTPYERWQSFLGQNWQPDTLNDEEMRDLFRPQVKCITRRGLVTVFTNEYFSKELEHFHGEPVYVNYDIHNWRVVWVRDMQQRIICEAVWGGNKRQYYPIAVVEQARQKRADRRMKLLEDKIQEVRDEAAGVTDIETHIPDECVTVEADLYICPDTHETGNHTGIAPTTADMCLADANPQARPLFEDEIARYEWHLKNGFHSDDDLKFKLSFEQSDSYRLLQSYWQ
jgi:putative transposase